MKHALTVAAAFEVATGIALVLAPALLGPPLLGVELSGVAVVLARVAGIALIALGVACLPGRTPLDGMLAYNALVTPYLAYVGLTGEFAGKLLWPVVVVHAVFAVLLARHRTAAWRTRETGT